jgi:hypothetical protein
MFFSLTNSPATFQHMMDSIFQCTIDKHRLLGTEILIYMDDILIASSSGTRGPSHRSPRRLSGPGGARPLLEAGEMRVGG